MEFVLCHRKPERSFFIRGKQFPVCARCTGIYLGYAFFPLFVFNVIHIGFIISVLLVLPTVIDGFTQAYYKRESNNVLRFVTGFMAGVGTISMLTIIGKNIGFFILDIIK